MKHMFLLGAAGYPILELIYRGRTHYSMVVAGGLSSVLIGKVRRTRLNLLTRSLLCGAGITAIEYACGLIWNRQYGVWDYRNAPLNYQGQICLPYTLLWCTLSAGMMLLMDRLER